jgi:DNA-binding NarL/FixJ family response regulator|tara:strand:+ start:2975 stop:3586 length:612 start_codon:yes stop_codon:yes gene_type:complete
MLENWERILIIDDHPLFADGLKAAIGTIASHIYVQIARTGNSGIELAQSRDYDLVFLDLKLPDMGGIEILNEFNRLSVHHPVIFISGDHNASLNMRAGQLGALGAMSKNIDREKLTNVLSAIDEGESYFEETMEDQVASCIKLTKREKQVLDGLNRGLSNKDITEELFISENTLRTHLRSLFKKFNVKNRTACVLEAKSHHLI